MFVTLKDGKMQNEAYNSTNIGEYLAYQREKQGLSQEKVAQGLCLSVERVRMLEKLTGEPSLHDVYTRGYLRSYCKLLKLESGMMSSLMNTKAPHYTDESDTVTDERTHELIRIWGSAVIITAIVGLLALWWIEQNSKISGTEIITPTYSTQGTPSDKIPNESFIPMPDLISSRTATSAFETTGQSEQLSTPDVTKGEDAIFRGVRNDASSHLTSLTIYADKQCWTYISDRVGNVIVNRLLEPGYRRTVFGFAPFKVKFGDATGIRLWVNDEPYNLHRHISSLRTAFFELQVK